MPADVNLIVRGQSNALLFVDQGGAHAMELEVERLVPGVDVHLRWAWGAEDGANSINSGTAFRDWPRDGLQEGFWRFVEGLPPGAGGGPTGTLWLHNEFDQGFPDLSTAEWVGLVRDDAAAVRGILGQGAAATPYVFAPVAYGGAADSLEAIVAGMERLSADAGFNASVSWGAYDPGYMDPWHFREGFADDVGRALAADVAPVVAALAGAEPPGAEPTGAEPPGAPARVAARFEAREAAAREALGDDPQRLEARLALLAAAEDAAVARALGRSGEEAEAGARAAPPDAPSPADFEAAAPAITAAAADQAFA